jgi:hypothetical protein
MTTTTQSAGRISIGNSIRQTESNFKRKKKAQNYIKKMRKFIPDAIIKRKERKRAWAGPGQLTCY